MGFFKNIFGSKEPTRLENDHDNTRLNFLLDKCSQNRSQANYELVMKELLEGNSFLILPSVDRVSKTDDWSTTNNDVTIQITSVFDLDGLKVLGAFSDEKSLLNWSKTMCVYTALKSQAALDICKEQNIDRIVINSDSPNIFIIERSANTKVLNIPKGDVLQIGTPAKALDDHIIQNLIASFKLKENILEAYQYIQSSSTGVSIFIGLKLLAYSDNGKKAALYAVQDALHKESSKLFVDIIFLDTEEWYLKVKNIEEALFYKRA